MGRKYCKFCNRKVNEPCPAKNSFCELSQELLDKVGKNPLTCDHLSYRETGNRVLFMIQLQCDDCEAFIWRPTWTMN